MASQRTLLVIGGCGNLGRSVISKFKSNWNIASIGLNINNESNKNIILPQNQSASQYVSEVKQQLKSFSPSYDAIICVAGGWNGGSIKDSNVFETYHKMHSVNVIPSILAAHLSTHFLRKNGLLVFTGAGGIINNPCHDMIGYGLSKVAVHSLASTMAVSKDMPEGSTVVTILPKVIDTPQNREAMPDSDFSTWAKPEQISGLLKMWAEGNNLPKTGSFAMLNVQNGSVVPEFI
ncbi:quinoid dihydropteridine reductase, putative (macronuclear) [Tetrahymena thermophila SB210]|uniref:Dihydropteridine reductase n=1 Tax=Tetrahymena thermophila (strain SB210) TaxID=312017 RepID=I7LVZ5_TETTS|nr:quinoid dihydropteridine reductase, putative [Tetrahymena thermophila SB210]EAS00398.1 quinoid dihydropteridine reductase, putative [Tetrahymena thermophila SB210]|eukprot:XP_001020643.1 quinoid dihydropteridine reductase, putative [Tetrahymena thermophila SB210]